MELDDVLGAIINKGRHQKLMLYGFIFPITILPPFFVANIFFMVAVPDHWCFVPGRETTNFTLQEWKEMTIPKEVGPDGAMRYSQCRMYSLGITDTVDELLGVNHLDFSLNTSTTACRHGWEYDRSEYTRTAATDNDWVCDKDTRSTNIMSYNAIGIAMGTLFFGHLADRIGRRLVFYMTYTVAVVFRASSIFLSQYYEIFVCLNILASTAFPMAYYAPLTLSVEWCDKDMRAWVVTITCVTWVMGSCLLSLVSWISGNWIIIGFLTTLPTLVVFIYLRLVTESPRWLLSQGRVKEVSHHIQHVAKINRRQVPENLEESLRNLMGNREKQYGVISLFVRRKVALKTIMISIAYLVNAVVYYGMQWNISNMGGNRFLNYFLLSIIELPSSILGWWIMDKFGRRWTQVFFFVLAGVCCFINAALYTDSDLQWMMTVISIFGKFCITLSFLVICVQMVEIYPTCVRSTGTSFSSVTGQAVAIAAPQIVYLGTYHQGIPYIIFAGFCILGALAASILPETLHQTLPETLEDSENFAAGRKFWSWKVPVKKTKKVADANAQEMQKFVNNI